MAKEKISQTSLTEIAETRMTTYGQKVLEDRSIPSIYDGLKPVQRRILWATHKLGLKPNKPFKKAARIVGDVIGMYHPHGDESIVGALITLANTTTPMIDGQGNWGSLTDPAGAIRYIETRLSQYAQNNFFEQYLGVIDMIPNYDESEMEPMVLPSNTLNFLINGTTGIAVGTSVKLPSFTLDSVNKLLRIALKKGQVKAKDVARTLEFQLPYGGTYDKESAATRTALKELAKSGRGSMQFVPDYRIEKNSIIITSFPANMKTGSVEEAVAAMRGVTLVDNQCSHKNGIHAYKFVVKLGRMEQKAKDALIKKVILRFGLRQTFRLAGNRKWRNKNGSIEQKFAQMGIIEIVEHWLKWRKELEVKRIKYDIQQLRKTLTRLDLLILAQNNRDVLDACRDKDSPRDYLIQKLKINEDEATVLLDLRVRQLTKIFARDLAAEREQLLNNIKSLKTDKKDVTPLLLKLLK